MLRESPECKLFADVEVKHSPCCNTIPSSIHATTNKPDIVIVDHSCKLIFVAELAILFEANIKTMTIRPINIQISCERELLLL